MKISKTLLGFACLTSTAFSQDLFRLRNNPDLILLSDESIMKVDSQKTHTELSEIAKATRSSLKSEGKEIQGSIATGKFELIFSDATIVSGNFQSDTQKPYFLQTLAPTEGEDKLFGIDAFPDADIQIGKMVVSSPFLIKAITHFNKKLNFGIFHIFSETDPSPNSRKIWSRVSEQLNSLSLEGLIQKHSASLENSEELSHAVATRQGTIKPRFIVIMSSKHQFGNARYKCFDGFSLPLPNVLDIRTKKTQTNAHPFSILPGSYNVFSHFLDPEEPATSLAPIPATGKNLLTVWQDLLAKTIAEQEEREMAAHPMPLHGLSNIGNTCYFNAATQALFALGAFKGLVDSMPLNEDLPFNLSSVFSGFFNSLISTPIAKQRIMPMQAFFGDVQRFLDLKSQLCDEERRYMCAKAGREFIKPVHFSEQIANHRLEHDSGELLVYILELLRIESEHRGDDVVASFDEKLGITTSASTGCKGCKKQSGVDSMDNILKVTLSKTSLKECFEEMTREEILTADNRWKCGTEKCSGDTVRQFQVIKWPEILIVQLNRFLAPDTKITGKIEYTPEMIFGDQRYDLMSVIMHHGSTIQAGHYTANVKAPDGKWYVADDSRIVGPMEFSVMNDGYILLFKKK